MNIELIWAQDEQGGIGKNGKLPWQISEDLKSWEPLFADAARIFQEEELNGRIRVNVLLKESLTPQFLRLRAVVK